MSIDGMVRAVEQARQEGEACPRCHGTGTSERTWRSLAEEIGIPVSQLYRIASGQAKTVSLVTMDRLLRWWESHEQTRLHIVQTEAFPVVVEMVESLQENLSENG